MVIESSKEPRPFLESKLEFDAPFARLGSDQVVFTVRDGVRSTLAAASVEGRGIVPFKAVSWTGKTRVSVAGAPDGKTIYYALDGSIYAIPVSGGAPTRLCAGQRVAVDPHGEFLLVTVPGDGIGSYLKRYSLSDRSEERLTFSETFPLRSDSLASDAVGPDGRILIQVAPLDSWFWPAAILDPRTGEMELATEYEADMPEPGWDSEGRMVICALFFRSSIWRFRPEN